MKLFIFFIIFFIFTNSVKSEEVLCHFDIETDEIGTPLCEGGECTFEIVFPNDDNHKIIRANLKREEGGDYFMVDLALEKFEEKASSLIFFSKSHASMELSAYYQLKGCIGRVKYRIQNGLLEKIN